MSRHDDAFREAAEDQDWTYRDPAAERQRLHETFRDALQPPTTEEAESADDAPPAD